MRKLVGDDGGTACYMYVSRTLGTLFLQQNVGGLARRLCSLQEQGFRVRVAVQLDDIHCTPRFDLPRPINSISLGIIYSLACCTRAHRGACSRFGGCVGVVGPLVAEPRLLRRLLLILHAQKKGLFSPSPLNFLPSKLLLPRRSAVPRRFPDASGAASGYGWARDLTRQHRQSPRTATDPADRPVLSSSPCRAAPGT